SLLEVFGAERQIAVARELTKKFEEVRRGSVPELLAWAQDGVRGEIAVVVSGAQAPAAGKPEDHVGQVQQLITAGTRMKQAVAEVAEAGGLKKGELYEAVLAARQQGEK